MPEHDDFYTSTHIDEQVDALLQAQGTLTRDQRLGADLHDILTNEQGDARSLQNVWHKLLQEIGELPGPEMHPISERPSMQGRSVVMHNNETLRNTRHIKPVARVLTVFAAVLIIAVLVGSLLVLLHTYQQPRSSPLSPINPSVQTPTPIVNEGKVIYHSGTLLDTTPLAWSPDGLRVAGASAEVQQNGTQWQIRSWDALTGQHVVTYQASGMPMYGERPVLMVAWSPDGNSLAVATFSEQVYIFDAHSAKLIRIFSPSVALSSPSTFSLATPGRAVNLPLSSLFPQGGSPITTPQMAWSSDGKYLVESIQNKILIWDATTGKPVKQMTDFYPGPMRAFWEPHGNLLAIIDCSDTMCRPNSTVEASIWDTTTWQLVKQYPNIDALDWSPNGKQLALISPDRQSVRIVDALTGQTVKQIMGAQKTQISMLHWSPDGSRLAEEVSERTTGMQTITIWSIATGKLLYTFPQYADEATWSPDGKYIGCRQDVKASDGSAKTEIAIWIA